MANQHTNNDPNNQIEEDPSKEVPTPAAEDDEFKITVKKLDFVVKPRGVLAE
jgi:hypothetical protein